MQTAVTIFTWPRIICTLVLLERQVDYLVLGCCVLPFTLALLGLRIVSVRKDYHVGGGWGTDSTDTCAPVQGAFLVAARGACLLALALS